LELPSEVSCSTSTAAISRRAALPLGAIATAAVRSTGNAKQQTARANWSRYLDSLFRLAKIDGGHSHRFRDTFAVDLLLAGVLLDTVSTFLGHSSVKITERHLQAVGPIAATEA